jgi:hypothetical protein
MRRKVPVYLPGRDLVGEALLEADGSVTMVYFEPGLEKIYGPVFHDFHYVTYVSDKPYVLMVRKNDEARRGVIRPSIADTPDNILKEAAEVVKEIGLSAHTAERVIAALVLHGFIIHRNRKPGDADTTIQATDPT